MNLYDTIFLCWLCPTTFMQECRCLVETVFGYGRCDYHLIACHHISFLVAVMHNVGSDRKLTCDTFTWHMKCPALLKVLESQFGHADTFLFSSSMQAYGPKSWCPKQIWMRSRVSWWCWEPRTARRQTVTLPHTPSSGTSSLTTASW